MSSSSSLPKSRHFSPREVHEAHPHRRHAAGRTTTPRVASFDPHRRPLLWSAPETSSSLKRVQKKCQTLVRIRVWNAPRICVFFLRGVHFYTRTSTHVDTRARARVVHRRTDASIRTSSSCLHHRRLCTRRRSPRASRWRRHHRHHAARGRWRRRQHPNAPLEPRRSPWRTRDGWPRCNNRCDEKFPT